MNPVLLIGGSGAVGSRAARALRQLQPGLPITIGAREIGGADTVKIDLDRKDLGLPAGAAHSAVVVLLKDPVLHSMRYAQAHGLPYVSFSDFVFDIGPEVALYIRNPGAAPILLLGQFLGGTAALAALHFAREFRRVDSIAIGGVLDGDDLGGPVAQADIERLSRGAPRPLLREGGRFVWAGEAQATRRFIDADGIEREGQAYPLLGLAGGAPVAPGLYHPEELMDPAYVIERLRGFGTEIRREAPTPRTA